MSRSTREYFLAAKHVSGLGAKRLNHLLTQVEGINTLFELKHNDLRGLGATERIADGLANPNWQAVDDDLNWQAIPGHHIVSLRCDDYPQSLKEIPNPPPILYVKGHLEVLHQTQLAIVGSRNPSHTGKDASFQFAYDLAQNGLVITSGLALGVDAAAHKGALAASGPTIAVFGTGLDKIYPASHRQLAEQILSTGALVSEFAPKSDARASHFPQRNRIISGLSVGVVVIEAALKSGSLISAQYALEQGREVFAMPGSIHNPLAKGCHALIRQGAKLVEQSADIYEEILHTFNPPNDTQKGEKKQETEQSSLHFVNDPDYIKLIEGIDFEGTSVDTLIARTQFSASAVSSMLLMLELQGLIRPVPGGYARRRRP